MKKSVLAVVMTATLFTSVPAFGDPPPWAPAHGRRGHDRSDNYERGRQYDNYQRDYQRDYQRTDNGIAYWQGNDGRYYCRRSNGTTGLLVGAVLGGLLGRTIDRNGDRSAGTILGAAAGALLGREVERGQSRCR